MQGLWGVWFIGFRLIGFRVYSVEGLSGLGLYPTRA